MKSAKARGLLLAAALICASYAVLLAGSPTARRGWLSVLALMLAVGAGWLAGARAGGALGALLGALQLAFAPATATPVVTYFTFVVGQLVLVVAGYGTGTARQRLDHALAHAVQREVRFALAHGEVAPTWDGAGRFRWLLGPSPAEYAAQLAGSLTESDASDADDPAPERAFHDPLTALPGRALFHDRVQQAAARVRRRPGAALAVMVVELDALARVRAWRNEADAERVLGALSERVTASLREGDTVAVLGGDRLGVLLDGLDDAQHAERLAEQIQRALAVPVTVEDETLASMASLGVVVARDDAYDGISLLRRAEQALAGAQQEGGGRIAVFQPDVHASGSLRDALADALHEALTASRLHVYLQPIVALSDGSIRGFEALVRWPHPQLGMIAPAELLPVAERAAALVSLDDFVLGEACRTVRRLQDRFAPATPFRVAVNVARSELDDSLVSRVERALAAAALPPEALTLEVQEDALPDDHDAPERLALRAVRARGVRVYLDDFGRGLASPSDLHRFELDGLKIDAGFIARLQDDPRAVELVGSVLALARALGLEVIAEGVESRAQRSQLEALGCPAAQGFLFAAAMPVAAVESLLGRGASLAVER